MTRPSDYTLRRLMAEGLGPAEIAARCLVSWQSVRDRLSDLAPAQDASPAPPSPPPPPRPDDGRGKRGLNFRKQRRSP